MHYYTGEGVRWQVAGKEAESDWRPITDEASVLSDLLETRGVSLINQDSFLHPSLDELNDPFLFEEMRKAAERVVCAIKGKHHILVYGDYDADGVTSVAILKKFFSKLGLKISVYIPDRADEGYGISDTAVSKIIESQVQLLITVDCGITAKKQIDAIQSGRLGKSPPIDIIITDHHRPDKDSIPDVFALINPHLEGCGYPFKYLCGAGVAWKLVQAVSILLDKPELPWDSLDLVAFATIADIVELSGENRVLSYHGIKKMNNCPNLGLAALHEVSGGKQAEIDSARVGFTLAPRVNAAGRMGNAIDALKLLTATTAIAASEQAAILNEINIRRQDVQEKIYLEAQAAISSRSEYISEPVIVVWGENWHHGVIGIVASKLVEKFCKPIVVLTTSCTEAIGSGRSIKGFDLFSAFAQLSKLLTRFGGHSQAAGLSLLPSDLDTFRTKMNEYASKIITPEMLIPVLDIASELSLEIITDSLAKSLKLLEPTGQGNRVPVYLLRNLSILEASTMSEGRHLRVKLGTSEDFINCIGFGMGEISTHLLVGASVDIAGTIEINEWQGRASVQLRLCKIRLPMGARKENQLMSEAVRKLELLDCDEEWFYNWIVRSELPREAILPVRNDIAAVYRNLKEIEKKVCKVSDLFLMGYKLKDCSGRQLGYFRLMSSLLILDELELITVTLRPDGDYEFGTKNIDKSAAKTELSNSDIFQFIAELGNACIV